MNEFNPVADAMKPVGNTGSRSVVRRNEPIALTPAQLAERSLIPYTDGADRQLVDSFRELRTRLLATSSDNFITLVTPVSAKCGGSFVARNLALAMTLDQAHNALLIDCNLRRPSQHIAMKIDASHGGLIEYLENEGTDVESMLYSTGIPRLKLIPAGHSSYGDMETEYFSMFRMRLLLDSLRSHYADRYIFLDGPPTLGAPDARMLSELADVVILVTGYGRNTPADIAIAAGNFDPVKFAGVVFNENT